MRKIFILSLVFVLSASFVKAEESLLRKRIENILQERKETTVSPKQIEEEIKEKIREKIKNRKELKITQIKEKIKKLKMPARIKGILKEKNNDSLVIEDEGKNYTVKLTDKTRLLRHYGGQSNLNEFSVGDVLSVFGRYVNENKQVIEAFLIKDNSIQKFRGTLFGRVNEKKIDYFTLETKKRGVLTVYFSASTKFLTHKKEQMKYEDLAIGSRVRVKGVWNKKTNQILETVEVRVFPESKKITPSPLEKD